MANAGRVELDLVAVGKDQVSAMLRQVESQARRMADGMKGAGKDSEALGKKLDGLKDAAKPVNKVRETFENLRSNAFFVVGSLGAIAGGVVALAKAFDTSLRDINAWRDAQKETAAALDTARKAYEGLQKVIGNRVESDAARSVEDARKAWEGLGPRIDTAHAAIRGFQEQLDRINRISQSDQFARLLSERQDAVERISHEMGIAKLELESLERERLNLALEIGDALRGQKDAMQEMVGISADIARAQRNAFPQPFFQQWPYKGDQKPRGGGGRKIKDQPGDFFGQSDGRRVSDRFTSVDMSDAWFKNPVADMESEGGLSENSEGGSSLARMATDAEKLRDALNGVADATSALAGDKFPELFGALSEIQTITQQVTDGKMKLGEALAASGAAALANTAKAIGGIRAEAALRAAYEVGLGFATLANPIESAGHFTAAALLGAVAVGAGGGSGGVRASSGGGRESASSGGPTTVVYNFSTMVTDRQQVTTALRQSQRSSRGTGHESRAGV